MDLFHWPLSLGIQVLVLGALPSGSCVTLLGAASWAGEVYKHPLPSLLQSSSFSPGGFSAF